MLCYALQWWDTPPLGCVAIKVQHGLFAISVHWAHFLSIANLSPTKLIKKSDVAICWPAIPYKRGSAICN